MNDAQTAIWMILFLGIPYALGIALVLIVQAWRLGQRLLQARRERTIVRDPPAPTDAIAAVFLVHGTFARHAAWTLSGSALRKSVARGFNGPVAFHRLLWSGANSVAARRAAARSLATKLTASLERHPNLRHYVIAHSHGGNIAMQALSQKPTLGAQCKLICLSTPFLVLRPRPDLPVVKFSSFLSAFLISMLLVRSLNIWVSPSEPGWWDLPIGLGALALSTWFGVSVTRMGPRIARELIENSRPPRVPRENVLLLRTLADEASMGIAAANMISQVTHVVLQVPLGLVADAHQRVESIRLRYKRYWWLALICVGIPILALRLLYDAPDDPNLGAEIAFLAVTGLLFAVLVFLSDAGRLAILGAAFAINVMLAPVLALISILAMATGREMALANPHVEFFAEPAPVGDWRLVVVGEDHPAPDMSSHMPALQHSQSYLNPSALRQIEAWIKKTG